MFSKQETSFEQDYIACQKSASTLFHENALAHGFWEDVEEMSAVIAQYAPHLIKRFDAMVMGEKIALMHSELSEALEAVRTNHRTPDHHCPEFTNLEIELADLDIRRQDLIKHMNLRGPEATLAKHAFNLTRPYKHNKQS